MRPKESKFFDGRKEYEAILRVTYVHHNKKCPNDGDRITEEHSATGATSSEANRRAEVLGENSLPVCPECANFYRIEKIEGAINDNTQR